MGLWECKRAVKLCGDGEKADQKSVKKSLRPSKCGKLIVVQIVHSRV